MNNFTATALRDEGWWVIQLEEEPGLITQTRRLDQVEKTVQNALKLFPELTDDPQSAKVTVVIQGEEQQIAKSAKALNDEAKKAQEVASQAMREAATELLNRGITYRDIGHLLGISFQRAQKLATE